MSSRLTLTTGALLMAAAVALGALGAHALKTRLSPDALELWQHRSHLSRVACAGAAGHRDASVAACRSGPASAALRSLFVAGIALFAGSLYAMALGGGRAWGYVTPFGGLAFIAGWLMLAVTVARARNWASAPKMRSER